MQDVNAQHVSHTLRVMAIGSRVMLEVSDSLCQTAAAPVQAFNAQCLPSTMLDRVVNSRVLPEVYTRCAGQRP